MKPILSSLALAALSRPKIARLMGALRGDRCAVLMLHRFAGHAGWSRGHDVNEVRAMLQLLRSSGIRLLGLDAAIGEYWGDEAIQGRRLGPAVAVTVDDGYADFKEIGLPAFSEFDCPVTSFIVPDVIDGKSWFWWDRLDWMLRRLPSHGVTVSLAGCDIALRADAAVPTFTWQRPLVARLKRVPRREREEFMLAIERSVGQSPPSEAPAAYGVMGWSDLKQCESAGVQFGAHSLSHPVLSECSTEQLRHEVYGSGTRLKAELANPSSVFCYPYGLQDDFGTRECEMLFASPFRYAVSAMPGILTPSDAPQSPRDERRWRVPRFAFDGREGMVSRQLFF
jgi:peptidoglycan/xylan/chitin deacetylase (PgdA/CDA1 family)